jgi:hypothetical protein
LAEEKNPQKNVWSNLSLSLTPSPRVARVLLSEDKIMSHDAVENLLCFLPQKLRDGSKYGEKHRKAQKVYQSPVPSFNNILLLGIFM